MNRDHSDLLQVRFPSIREKILSIEGKVKKEVVSGARRRSSSKRYRGSIDEKLYASHIAKLQKAPVGRTCIDGDRWKSLNHEEYKQMNQIVTPSQAEIGEKSMNNEEPDRNSISKKAGNPSCEPVASFQNCENLPAKISDDDTEQDQEQSIDYCSKVPFHIQEVIIPEEQPRDDGICSEVDEDDDIDMDELDEFFYKQSYYPVKDAKTPGTSVITSPSVVSAASMTAFSLMSGSCLIQSSLSFIRSSGSTITAQTSQRLSFISDYYMNH